MAGDLAQKLIPYLRQIETLAGQGDMEAVAREARLALKLAGDKGKPAGSE